MKRSLFLFSLVFSMFLVHGQLNWESIPGAPQYGRDGAIHFTAGGKIYYGLGRIPTNPGGSGSVFSKDLWEYNPSNLKWTKKADFPGTGLFYATAFSINGIGYVGGGRNGSSYANAFYKYNPGTNTWTSIASYPGGRRTGMTSFVIGNIGYVGLGGTSGSSYSYTDRFYSYTPASNSWTSIASFPGGSSAFGSTFVIGTKGYVGCRNTSSATLSNNFWAYTPSTNSWNSIATMPGTARRGSFGFSLDGKGYIGMGTTDWAPVNTFLNTFYKYTANTNTWSSESSNTYINKRVTPNVWNIGDSVVIFGAGFGGTLPAQLTDFWQLDIAGNTSTTGINDLLNEGGCKGLDLKIYPNPSYNDLYLESSNLTCFQHARVELLNISGQVLWSEPYRMFIEMKTSEYPRGLYLVKIVTENGAILEYRKIVLR